MFFFEEINSTITESLSVSDDVVTSTDKLIEIMDAEFYKTPFDNVDNEMKHKHLQLSFNCFSKRLLVNVDVYFCDKRKEEDIISKNPFINDSNSYSRKGNFNIINFSFLCIKNKININKFTFEWFGSTIQHELNHIYQQIMKGDRYGGDDYRISKMIGFCNTNIHSPNKGKRVVANVIYLSQYVEQDSFINELDYEIRKNILKLKDRNFYKNSEPYKRYLCLKDCHEYILRNKTEIIQILNNEKLPIKYGTLVDLCDRGEQRIIDKISKVIIRNSDSIQLESMSTGLGNKHKLYLI